MIEFAQEEWQKVYKLPKFNDNFDIRRQLEHYEYEISHT